MDDLNAKLGQGKKKAGPAGISPRLFEECIEIFRGYGAVDSILEECESIGAHLRASIASWSTPTPSDKGKGKIDPLTALSDDVQDGSISLRTITNIKQQKSQDHLTKQPSYLSTDVKLKEYQLLGVNWLNLLYRNNLSCILADEMGMLFTYLELFYLAHVFLGLGKTVQVISFLAHLKEKGNKGPHLVVVP